VKPDDDALQPGTAVYKVAIAVDDDIDIYDAQDIIYALGTRVNPEKDIMQINGTLGIPYDLSLL